MSILESKLISALLQINEIGDTPRGQEFINKSIAKRKAQIHRMNKFAPTYQAKYDLGREANLAVLRGARQVDRTQAYMHGRDERKKLIQQHQKEQDKKPPEKRNRWSYKLKKAVMDQAGPTFYRLAKASRDTVDDNMDAEPSRGPIGLQMKRALRRAKRSQ